MTRLALVAILVIAATLAHATEPAELVGRWDMVAETTMVLELKPGGTGSIDGQPLAWSVEGTRLTVTDPSGTDTTEWPLDEDRLVLTAAFGIKIVFIREDVKPGAAGSSLPGASAGSHPRAATSVRRFRRLPP
jgi:hypothetical protein